MASFGKDVEGFSASRSVHIIGTETVENYTVYIIELLLGPYQWTVRHRYSEFHELHEKLVANHEIDKHLLPPKKIFGNQSEAFIKQRQRELEIYLQVILQHLKSLPTVLIRFLHFHRYEIHGLTQVLAEELYHIGDMMLQRDEIYHTSPLMLYCISSRLKLPEPTCDSGDNKKDLGHILDFITMLKHMKIVGSEERLGSSNINMNGLEYDLNAFKSLQYLEMDRCNCALISGVDKVKQSLTTLRIQNSLRAVKDIILCDVGQGHWYNEQLESVLVPAWSSLKSLDISHNHISSIDQSMKLLPVVEYLDLSHNDLESIDQLQYLSALTHVNLASNNIRQLHSLHTKFGNITSLSLAENHLDSLQGFSKLYSLEYLDLSGNEICQLLEVRHLNSLPCLEKLILQRNPIAQMIDYRTKVLELFTDRAKELCLDGEQTTQKEVDTVAVLAAIQKARESKERAKKQLSRRQAHAHDASSVNRSSSANRQHASRYATVFNDNDSSYSSYRSRVEALQQRGGEEWLSVFNHLRDHSPDSQTSRSEILHELGLPEDTLDVSSSLDSLFDDLELQGCPSNRYTSGAGAGAGDGSDTTTSFLLPETLPGKSNSDFTAHLQAIIPETRIYDQRSHRYRNREERTIYVMWCPVIAYTQPQKEIPACIYLTTEHVHIFVIAELKNSSGMPDLTHIYCIPLTKVQQIVLSYQDLYLRIEESFVGPQGTFALLTGSPHKTEEFVNILRQTIERADSGKDNSDDTHITYNGETLLSLKAALNTVEKLPNIDDVQVILYMLVHFCAGGVYSTHSFVLTNSHLYILREDYILWPQPTFGIGPAVRAKFEVVLVIPAASKINAVQLYDTDTMMKRETLTENMNVTGMAATLTPKDFIGFGVRISFTVPDNNVNVTTVSTTNKMFDIRVPTSGMREKFLVSLTQVRRVHGVSTSMSRGSRGRRKRSLDKNSPLSKTSVNQSASTSNDSLATNEPTPVNKPTPEQPVVKASTADTNTASPVAQSRLTDIKQTLLPVIHARDVDGDEPRVRTIQTPHSLGVGYPSIQLLGHLSQCNETMKLLNPLSPALATLTLMSGEEMLNYFHKSVAPIGQVNEELHHLLWTAVVPYMEPDREISTCVLLSNQAVYFLSDESPKMYKRRRPSWRTHSRNRSEAVGGSYVMDHEGPVDSYHPQSGVLVCASDAASPGRVKAYATVHLCDIQSVHIGFFDQLFRISSGGSEEDCGVFSCITRNATFTELFLKRLMSVLSTMSKAPTPSPVGEYGPDIFKKYGTSHHDGCWRPDGLEYRHPSKVKFIYPNEDATRDLTFLMSERIRGSPARSIAGKTKSTSADTSSVKSLTLEGTRENPSSVCMNILQYVLVLQMQAPSTSDTCFPESPSKQAYSSYARSLIITTTHLCLVTEDNVSYPLPDFARGLPERPRFHIEDVCSIRSVQRVVCSDFMSHDVTIYFGSDEIKVDTGHEHYSMGTTTEIKRESIQSEEKVWSLVIQSPQDKSRLLKLIERQLDVIEPGRTLSVQVSA